MSQNLKIAIVSEQDDVWLLSAWDKSIELLIGAGHDITGVWLTPPTLSKYRGHQIIFWYLKTFGLYDFLKLGLFAVIIRIKSKFTSFEKMGRKFNVPIQKIYSVNDDAFIAQLKMHNVDVLFITLGQILKAPVINAPRLGCINKHSAILPSYKGLMPYVWATIDKASQGVSVHTVTTEIDEGELLYQESLTVPRHLTSMVSFYKYIYREFPRIILIGLTNLIENKDFQPIATAIKPSYYSLPTRNDLKKFRNAGGRIITWQDFLHH